MARAQDVLVTLRATSASSVGRRGDKLDTANLDRADVDVRRRDGAGVPLLHRLCASQPQTLSVPENLKPPSSPYRYSVAIGRRRRYVDLKRPLWCDDEGSLDATDSNSSTTDGHWT